MRIASSLHFVDVISGYVFRRIGSVVNFDDWLFEMPQVIVNRLGKDCTTYVIVQTPQDIRDF